MAMTSLRRDVSLPALLVAMVLLVLTWSGLFAFISHDRAQVTENAYRQTENYSVAFEEYVHNIILNVDNSLVYLRQLYVDSQIADEPFERSLIDGYAPIKTFQFSIIGPDGILRYSNLAPARARVDLSDREHFRVHVGTAEDRLFISRPILGRVSGKWSIQFTRKVVMPDGSFGGVLVLSVEQREFEDFFERVDIGKRGLIALFGLDRWMRARGSQVPESLRDVASNQLPADRPYFRPDDPGRGRLEAIGFYDGTARLGSYLRVRDVPLVVSVQFAKDDVLAEHHERVERSIAIGLVLSLAVLLSVLVFSVLKRQRDTAIAEVSESEQRWRLALDAAGAGVWDWRPETNALYFSPQFQVVTGVAAHEVPRTVAGWLKTIHDDDRARVSRDFEAMLQGAPRFHSEYRLRQKDGGYRWILDRAVVVAWSAAHRPRRVIGLRSDISERRQLEDQLIQRNEEMRALQAALAAREIGAARHRLSEAQKVARLGIIERDVASGGWTACEHGRALLGLEPAATYSLEQLLAQVCADSHDAALQLLAGGDLSALNLELAVEVAGERRYLRAVGCAPATSDEPPFITLQDISAHRAAELEHARLKERMEEASRMEALGTLAGGIAHEINTPAQFVGDNMTFLEGGIASLLAVASAAAQGQARGDWAAVEAALAATDLDFLAKEMPEAVQQGLEGVARIGKIVQAVKEFCYPSSRERQPCDLNHMIESAATVTRNVWKYCAELRTELDPALPAVNVIEGEINQVLINLIVNAAQAIEERGGGTPGHIVIRTFHDGETVGFAVEDSGVGIPPERHKRIFELFYTTKPPGQGTGQGLAISSAIVRRHGGTIDVASQPGEGACFSVSLPLAQPEDAEEPVFL